MALERFPIRWNHLIERESLKFNELEHVPIEKVEQLFRNMLQRPASGEPHGRRHVSRRRRSSPKLRPLAEDELIASLNIPAEFKQLVLVTTESWTSQNGMMERFERTLGGWCHAGSASPVATGTAGLGWGRGVHQPIDSPPQKLEGDGRGPAGAFLLGPAFGYGELPPMGAKLAYRQATSSDYYVDDPESSDYNKWVHLPLEDNDPAKHWRSFEFMRRTDDLYKLGIIIHQNVSPTVLKGRGSAVFLHIWSSSSTPTAGCTAMAENDIRQLIAWLDPKLNPILIQAPLSDLANIRIAGGARG